MQVIVNWLLSRC